MKHVRNLGILLIITGLLLLTVENVQAYVGSITEEQQKLAEIKLNLENKYNEFTNHILEYKELLPTLSGFSDHYYETIYEARKEYNDIMLQLEEKVESATNEISALEEYCSYTFLEERLNQKCEVYKQNYEALQTSFTNTVEKYNLVIEDYNNWAEITNNTPLEIFTAKTSEFIE